MPILLDLTPLRVSVPYRRMWIGVSLSGVGTALTNVAVGLQVYDLTGSTLSVGLVGLFGLVPLVVLGLYGGAITDAHDRRRVILVSATGLWLVAVAFAVQAWLRLEVVGVLYALVSLQNACYAVNSPARLASVPRLVGARLLPAANALGALSGGITLTVGPLLAGVLVARAGYGWTYTVEACLVLVALVSLRALPAMPPEGVVRRAGLGSVLEGLTFLRTRPNLRATFVIDLMAMVLANPRVLLPAIGAVLIGGGATTVGVLTAGVAVGAVLAGLFSGPVGAVRRQGLAVAVAVVGWGTAIIAFGVVVVLAPGSHDDPATGTTAWALWSATACMVLAGAADTISSIFRNTILQAATPDAMRGRLQGVFIVVVAGGPRLGDLALGWIGSATGEGVAAVAGGAACVVGVVAFVALQPRLRRYDARHPEP